MKTLTKILFPVDLSEASPKISPWVTSMAETFGAEVHVVYVVRVFSKYSVLGISTSYLSDIEDEIVKGAETTLADFVVKNLGNLSKVVKVITGDPEEEILKYAQENAIDLIVIGTHGRKGIDKILFGSVAEQVVKKSPIPVLTIKPYQPEETKT